MKLNNKQKEIRKAMTNDVTMYFIVPKDLKMDKGKVCSQVGHGSIGLYKEMIKSKTNLLDFWESNGSKKIVLKCTNGKDLNKILNQIKEKKILHHCVYDAGKTQVESGSFTTLCMIDKHNILKQYVGHLKLM
jgi:PTH2 family peptidyl-tRNA hydrolase